MGPVDVGEDFGEDDGGLGREERADDPPRHQDTAHWQTSCAVYQVYNGEGYSVIDGQQYDWNGGDFFVVPPWAWHEHANDSGKESVLISIQDIPVLKDLALYREEPYTENAGHQ